MLTKTVGSDARLHALRGRRTEGEMMGMKKLTVMAGAVTFAAGALLFGVGAASGTAIDTNVLPTLGVDLVRPTVVPSNTGSAFSGPRFKPFTPWSSPVNLGAPVNTQYEESAPAISADGRSLYFNLNTNGQDPNQPGKVDEDIYVSHRRNQHKPWGEPTPVEALNTPTFHERNVALSRDGSMLFFSSNRLPGSLGGLDLYVSQRVDKNPHAPDGWSPPINLGALVNSTVDDIGPGYFDNKHGNAVLYFTSARPGGPGLLDIYASEQGADGSFGMPVLVRELSSASNDARPAIRADGLEVVLQSNRQPSAGLGDVWVSTRETLLEPWGTPVSLGPVINTVFQDRQAALSDDAETLYFVSNRPGAGLDDIWISTRERQKAE